MKDTFSPWVMLTCPICGKEFLPAGQHYWKIGDIPSKEQLVCTYSCMRKWEKLPKKKRKLKANNKAVEVRVVETGQIFGSIEECAEALNVSDKTIRNCIYYYRTAKGMHIEKVWK